MKILLNGCSAEPFSSYLKSLAILRLLGEQKDENLRGTWLGGKLEIQSSLDRESIIDFFLEKYTPTPIVSPWNGGSGFYQGDDTTGIDAIIGDKSPRFQLYRDTIRKVQNFTELRGHGMSLRDQLKVLSNELLNKSESGKTKLAKLISETEKAASAVNVFSSGVDVQDYSVTEVKERITKLSPESKAAGKKLSKQVKLVNTEYNRLNRTGNKTGIIRACRNYLDQAVVEWIDAAVLVDANGEQKFPPILGSGGNEGRLEYSKEFMHNLQFLMLEPKNKTISRNLLNNALFGEPTSGFIDGPIGKFDPGRAGGFNQGFGDEQKDFPVNPWDFVLLMEGTILWASSVGKRNSVNSGAPRSPFSVAVSPVGYSSSSLYESGTYEIWVPLWKNPLGIRELKVFFREGRSEVGRRPARNGIEFAEAVSSLSVDRGISEFVRYPILKRRGDSYIAVPAGRFMVKLRKEADLVRELAQILKRVDSFLRKFRQSPPADLRSLRSNVDRAIFEVLLHGGSAEMIKLLSAVGALEKAISRRDHGKEPRIEMPLTGLSFRWLTMADDGSIEFRLAAAIASIGPTDGVGPIRSSIEPVDPEKPYLWSNGRGQVAWSGNTFASRLANVLHRRMMDADRLKCKGNPLRGSIKLQIDDISHFISGDIDELLIENILFGLMWIRWNNHDAQRECVAITNKWKQAAWTDVVPRSWALIKLLFLPTPLRLGNGQEIHLKREISIISLLNAGRTREACEVARKRLHSSRLDPVSTEFPDIRGGERISAALIFPLRNEKALINMVLNVREQVI